MNKHEQAKQDRADAKAEAKQHRADVKEEARKESIRDIEAGKETQERKAARKEEVHGHAAEKSVAAKPLAPVETPERRKEKVEAYLRLVKLDAAPAVSFNPHDDPQVYAQAEAQVAAEKYSEILRNRKILGIGVHHEQVNVTEPKEWRRGRENNEKAAAEKKPEGKVMTTHSLFGK
jgi:hypothetical protein